MKALVSLLVVFGFCSLAYAAYSPTGNVAADAVSSRGGSLSSTATAANISLNHSNVYIENDGSDEVYINLNDTAVADTSDFYLSSGEFVTIRSSENRKIHKLGYVCDTAETATVRYLAWD